MAGGGRGGGGRGGGEPQCRNREQLDWLRDRLGGLPWRNPPVRGRVSWCFYHSVRLWMTRRVKLFQRADPGRTPSNSAGPVPRSGGPRNWRKHSVPSKGRRQPLLDLVSERPRHCLELPAQRRHRPPMRRPHSLAGFCGGSGYSAACPRFSGRRSGPAGADRSRPDLHGGPVTRSCSSAAVAGQQPCGAPIRRAGWGPSQPTAPPRFTLSTVGCRNRQGSIAGRALNWKSPSRSLDDREPPLPTGSLGF